MANLPSRWSATRNDGRRTSDCIARIGGDEFAVLLPDTSPVQAARVAASVTDEIGRACIRSQDPP